MTPVNSAPTGPADERRGILWMLLTMLLLANSDALAKYLTITYPVAEVVWSRFLYVVPLVLLWGRRLPEVAATPRPGLQVARGLMVVTTMGFLYLGLSYLPLADSMAIMFVAPVLVTAFSMPLLGEKVGPRRRLCVIAGFLGALIVIRPGTGMMHWAAFLPLAAAFFFAFHQIAARVLSRTDTPMTTLFYTSVAGAVTTSIVVPFLWVAPDAEGWMLMGLMALSTGFSNFTIIKAFESAPAAVVSPFTFTILIWATLYGFFLFGDLPDLWTLSGAVFIVASGLYMFQRERRQEVAGAD